MRKRLIAGLVALVLVVVGGLVYQSNVSAATALSGKFLVQIDGMFSNPLDLVTVTANQQLKLEKSFTNGTGASQADMIWTDERTIAASTTEDLDVVAGGMSDVFGTTFTIAELKMLAVCASSTNTNNVVLGGDANSVPFLSTAATTVSIKPGGCFALMDPSAGGVAVTAATGDIIQVANSGAGTTVTYKIVIVGSSV